MTQEKKPIDVGRDIAAILSDWRPEMNAADVADAIYYALENYSKNTDGSSESGMAYCMRLVKDIFDERLRSV